MPQVSLHATNKVTCHKYKVTCRKYEVACYKYKVTCHKNLLKKHIPKVPANHISFYKGNLKIYKGKYSSGAFDQSATFLLTFL